MLYFFSAPLKGWRGVRQSGLVLWEKHVFIPIKTIPLKNQQQIELIYLPQHPEKAAVYSLWGYWFTWGEILMSSVLLFAMYQLAVSITQNPTAASLANQLKIDDVPKRKYEG